MNIYTVSTTSVCKEELSSNYIETFISKEKAIKRFDDLKKEWLFSIEQREYEYGFEDFNIEEWENDAIVQDNYSDNYIMTHYCFNEGEEFIIEFQAHEVNE